MPIDPTPRSDYEHWNEERDLMWWEEVGKHASTQNDPPDPDEEYDHYIEPYLDEEDYE